MISLILEFIAGFIAGYFIVKATFVYRENKQHEKEFQEAIDAYKKQKKGI